MRYRVDKDLDVPSPKKNSFLASHSPAPITNVSLKKQNSTPYQTHDHREIVTYKTKENVRQGCSSLESRV